MNIYTEDGFKLIIKVNMIAYFFYQHPTLICSFASISIQDDTVYA